MGCGGSSEPQVVQSQPPPPQQQQQKQGQGNPQFGWGTSGAKVIVEAPNPNDPAFMQTVAPSGTSWGQYVRTGASFVDPKTGFLAGPWAECIAWAVVFEHNNDWEKMPQYAADGVVGGVLEALERTLQGRPNKNGVMEAAQRLEDSSHELMNSGKPVPTINQVVTVPPNAVPGQMIKIQNPQTPGTAMNLQVPPNAQPGQQILAPSPVQPTQSGKMSTGGKVALAAGGAVAVGALAAGAYYGLGPGGGLDGLAGDMGAAGGAIGGAAEAAGGALGGAADAAGGALGDAAGAVAGSDAFGAVSGVAGDAAGAVGGAAEGAAGAVADWAPGAVDTAGGFAGDAAGAVGGAAEGAAGAVADWAPGAMDTAGGFAGDAFGAAADWAPGAMDSVGDFGGEALEGIGDFLSDLF